MGAVLIDGLIGYAFQIPGTILGVIGGTQDLEALALIGNLLSLIGGIGFGFYNLYLLGSRGSTVGKKILGLTVLGDDNQPIGFGKAFLREVLKGIFGCFIVPSLWLLWDKERQNLYEKVVNTHVYRQ